MPWIEWVNERPTATASGANQDRSGRSIRVYSIGVVRVIPLAWFYLVVSVSNPIAVCSNDMIRHTFEVFKCES